MRTIDLRHALVLPAVVALAGCGAAPSSTDPDPAGTDPSAIVGGSNVAVDTLGTAELLECPSGTQGCTFSAGSASWGCSGNMVGDRWYLTAHHCVTAGGEALTGGTAVPANTLRVQSPSGHSWATGVAVFRHPTLDVALVYLDGSIVSDTGQVYFTPIYSGTSASLQGATVYCQGFGLNQVANGGSGFGTLRGASFTVAGG